MKRSALHRLAGGSLVVLVLMLAGPVTTLAQSDSAAAAAAEVRFQQLEKEIRRLTGQIEEQNYKIQQLQEELARQTGDLSVRVSDLEGGNGGSGSSAGTPSNNSIPMGNDQNYTAQPNQAPDDVDAQAAPEPSEFDRSHDQASSFYTPPSSDDNSQSQHSDDSNQSSSTASGQLGTLKQSPDTGRVSGGGEAAEYEQAYGYIKSNNYDEAERAFEAFIDKYPNSSYMTNAKYWYGETFYVRGQYDKSARIFAESYQANPKGAKAAGNLLKLGMSLAGLGKKDDACVAFKQLKKDYASSAVPVLKRADTEMKKIGCK